MDDRWKKRGGGGVGSQLIKVYQVYTRAWRRLFIFASKSMIRLVNIIDVFPCSLFGNTQF